MVLQDAAALDRNLRQALIESRQRFKDLVEISSDFAWETDATGRFAYVSPQGALGWAAAELVGLAAGSLAREADEAAIFSARAPVANEELRARRADGGEAMLAVSAVPVLDGAGAWCGARGLCRDVTEARRRARALAEAQLRLRLFTRILRVLRDEPDPAAALDAALSELGLAVGAAGALVLHGPEPAALAPAVAWGEPAPGGLVEAAQAVFANGPAVDWQGAERRAVGHLSRCRQQVQGALLVWRDDDGNDFAAADRALVAEIADYVGLLLLQRASLEQVLADSRTDPLTGLANRRAFAEALDRALARLTRADAEEEEPCGALLYIDLDNFKLVNDRRGHAAGDDALRRFARILSSIGRAGDLSARLGGDEFALWIAGIGSEAAVERADRLRQACRDLAGLTGDAARPLRPSVGIAVAKSGDAADAAALFASADAAMYEAKAARR